ncbi:GNAT family N-acetyltransferase [Candidatus Latescibacterota bacterium]
MRYELRQVTWQSPEADKLEAVKFSSGNYLWATRSRLEAPWGDEIYGLVGAFSGDQCLGTTAYTLSARGQGILSQVFTDPEYRGRGIGTATLNGAIAAFRDQGARAVYLAAWEDWKRALYERVGFRLVGAMGERHAYKLTLGPKGDDETLFAPGQSACLRELGPGDQGDVSALFNAHHPGVVKHYGLECFLGSHFEGEFYALQQDRQRPGVRALVLDGQQTILGFATVLPSRRRHQTHRGTVDVLVHAHYAGRFPELLGALHQDTPLESLVAYVEDSEDERRRVLEAAGYKAIGRLESGVRIGSEAYNLTMYEKRMGPTARGRQG